MRPRRTTVPTATGPVAAQVVEHCHADDQAGAHLVDDERGFGIGDAGVDLDAAVHRPGVHHLLAEAEPLGRDAPAGAVLPQGGNVVGALLHPLALHPEDVDDVGGADCVDVVGHLAELLRDERRRPDEHDARADELEPLDQRPCNARVQHVPDDRDVNALEPAERVLDRVEVEQRLGSDAGCLPSPALTTWASVTEATRCGAPICGWRITITSGS